MRPDELVRARQRGDALANLVGEALVLRRLACRKAYQATDDREDVLDPVAQLAAEDFDLLALPLGVVDVGAGADPPHDLALGIVHRHRSPERPAIFAAMMA